MSSILNFEPVFPHHDLMVEIARVEMAIEHLDRRTENERRLLRGRLEQRMHHLQNELEQLAA